MLIFGIWNLAFDKAQGPEPVEGESGIEIVRIIAGSFKGRKIISPKGYRTRPTSDRVREAVFSIVGERVLKAGVLDLYAGTGAMGLEAISRGSGKVVFVETDPSALTCIKRNIETFGCSGKARVVHSSVLSFLNSMDPGDRYDLVFADPPYAGELGTLTLLAISKHAKSLRGSLIILEHAPDHEPKAVPVNLNALETRVYGNTGITFLSFIGHGGTD